MDDDVTVVITGLRELRRDLKHAAVEAPRAVTGALKEAGKPLLARTRELERAANKSGRLASGYKIRASGTTGRLVNVEPYAVGSEFGVKKKWRGFNRYGPRGERFGYRAIGEEKVQAEIARILDHELEDILTAFGWFQPS